MLRPHRPSSRSRFTHVLTGLGIALTSFLLVLGVFLGALTVVQLLRLSIEARIDAVVVAARREEEVVPGKSDFLQEVGLPHIGSSPSSLVASLPAEELIFASFSDLFSSNAALEGAGTTMYRDDAATAFLFPPKLVWAESGKSDFLQEVGLPNVESAVSCVQSVCLSAKGTVLTKDGAVIQLPIEGGIENVSVDVVGNEWLVGIVRKEGSGYAGYAYRYNGKMFAPIFPKEKAFESEYKGVWGFGGAADDFLAVYGAYQGKGYRIRSNSPFPKGSTAEPGGIFSVTDLSWLFDVRIMRGGITPGITRVGSGVHTTWYLWNKERNNRPIFIKLFQNGTEDIVGEADLMGTAPQGFSYFAIADSRKSDFPREVRLPNIDVFPYSLVGYGERSGIVSVWSIRDEGFKAPPGPVTVTSVNLNNYQAEVPHILKAAFREFSLGPPKDSPTAPAGEALIALAVSNGGIWESIEAGGKGLWFKNPHGTALKWRMTVTPGTNPEYTPFIGIFDLDYEVKKF